MNEWLERYGFRIIRDILIISNIYLVTFLFLLAHPEAFVKVVTVTKDLVCSPSSNIYSYKTDLKEWQATLEITSAIDNLNQHLGFKAFVYDEKSPNKISLVENLGRSGIHTTIGHTWCTTFCCGNNSYSVEFLKSAITSYQDGEIKILIWHEIGHVVGLDHDDSGPDIMNTELMSQGLDTKEVDTRYIAKIKKKMGIK